MLNMEWLALRSLTSEGARPGLDADAAGQAGRIWLVRATFRLARVLEVEDRGDWVISLEGMS
jgi:hypothetical protein